MFQTSCDRNWNFKYFDFKYCGGLKIFKVCVPMPVFPLTRKWELIAYSLSPTLWEKGSQINRPRIHVRLNIAQLEQTGEENASIIRIIVRRWDTKTQRTSAAYIMMIHSSLVLIQISLYIKLFCNQTAEQNAWYGENILLLCVSFPPTRTFHSFANNYQQSCTPRTNSYKLFSSPNWNLRRVSNMWPANHGFVSMIKSRFSYLAFSSLAAAWLSSI